MKMKIVSDNQRRVRPFLVRSLLARAVFPTLAAAVMFISGVEVGMRSTPDFRTVLPQTEALVIKVISQEMKAEEEKALRKESDKEVDELSGMLTECAKFLKECSLRLKSCSGSDSRDIFEGNNPDTKGKAVLSI